LQRSRRTFFDLIHIDGIKGVDHTYYTKKSWKIPKGAIIIYRSRTDNTTAKRTNRTKKGLHIKVQEVCKAVYEPHRDKQNKGLHIKVQKVCKAVYEPHRDKQNKETKGLTQSTRKV